jgi:hypothetical protein
MTKFATALLFFTALVALLNLARTSTVLAAPRAQSTSTLSSPTPTDEPPKPPYVFPTPIFIPTNPGDTPIATAAPRTTGQPTGQDTYTVQSGDSPWIIAQKVYGNGSKYPLIMSANNLTDSTRLRVGMLLKIPPLEGAQPLAPTTPPASLPTSALPDLVTTAAPAGVSATPAVTLTTTPAGAVSNSVSDIAKTAVNVLAAILVFGAFMAAILAFLAYNRTRQMEELNPSKRRLQIRQ